MTAPKPERILAPRAMFLGFLTAFLCCCLGGVLAAKAGFGPHFVRFHREINPETWFYPTPDQVVSTARRQTSPDKITVVIGGNSILFGTGQSEQHLWSRHLQERLGDEFEVINLCLPGSFPFEFGGTSAEILARERPRLIFVTLTSACSGTGQFDQTYRYYVWSAKSRGLLDDDPARDAWMKEFEKANKGSTTWQESKKRAAVDRWCHCSDLWTNVSYHHFSTVWSYLLGPKSAAARKTLPDPDPGQSVPQPMSLEQARCEANRVREASQRKDSQQMAENLARFCPASLKDYTLFLVMRESPVFVNRLSNEDRSSYETYLADLANAIRRVGFGAVNVTENFPDHYFLDRCHLTEPGGHQLAEEAAPAIREQARRMGYLEDK